MVLSIVNVEKLVCTVLDDLLVNGIYNGIILGTANALHSVCFVEPLASCFLSIAEIGLTAAVYTASGTRHDLDEIEVLACRCAEKNSF